jgi:hypothetical protein
VWRYAPTPDYSPACYMRVLSAMRMMLKAMEWVETLPFWARRGGADHMFLMSHDEGACWAPQRVWPAMMLTHYGTFMNPERETLRTDRCSYRVLSSLQSSPRRSQGPFGEPLERPAPSPQPSLARLAADAWGCGERRAGYADAAPVQSSGYAHDNWKFNCTDPQAYPAGTSKDIGDHPCFDPQKDIVVPQFKSEPAYGLPEGCLSPERPRKNLAFFAGRIREHPHRPLTPPVESLREVSAVQLLLTAKESQGDTTL